MPRTRRSDPNPPNNPLPGWWPIDVAVADEERSLLRPTALETITVVLCWPELKLGFEYSTGHDDKLGLEGLPSQRVLRQAILALRRERTDQAALEQYLKLEDAIAELQNKRELLFNQLPRELRYP